MPWYNYMYDIMFIQLFSAFSIFTYRMALQSMGEENLLIKMISIHVLYIVYILHVDILTRQCAQPLHEAISSALDSSQTPTDLQGSQHQHKLRSFGTVHSDHGSAVQNAQSILTSPLQENIFSSAEDITKNISVICCIWPNSINKS